MKMENKVRVVSAFCLVLAFCGLQAADVCASPDERELGRMLEKARALAVGPAYRPYAGWLEYLAGKIENNRRRGVLDEKTAVVISTLSEWLERIEADPDAWKQMR